MSVTQLEFTVQPSDTPVDRRILPAVRVALKDESGAIVASATDSVTIAIEDNPGGGVLLGTLTRNAVAGVAVFSNLRINAPGVDYTLRASADVSDIGPCSALPVELPGLLFDHVGACIVGEEGDNVHLWPDSSDQENDLENPSTISCPTVKAGFLNGMNVARYGDNEQPSTIALQVPVAVPVFTYIAVMRCDVDTSATPRTLVGRDGITGGSPQVRIFQGKINLAKQGVVTIGASATPMNTADFYTVAVTYDGFTAKFYLNGSPDGTVNNEQEFTQPITHQGAGAPNENFHGYIAEDLLVDAVLTLEELTAAFTALRDRWQHYSI